MGKKEKTKNESASATAARQQFPESLVNKMSSNSKKLQHTPPTIHHESPSFVATLPHFFAKELCEEWIRFVETSAELSYMHQRGTRYMAFRECYRCARNDSTVAQSVFELLRASTLGPLLPTGAVNCNPNIRLYKYTKGMKFGKHIDESATVPGVGTTRFTILIYLSSCQGGATRFEGDLAFVPDQGTLLIHAHGDECLEHEADPVLKGIKYVLRTDLVYES